MKQTDQTLTDTGRTNADVFAKKTGNGGANAPDLNGLRFMEQNEVAFATERSEQKQNPSDLRHTDEKISEDECLNQGERFDALERIAGRINSMDRLYRDAFIKQLAHTRDKRRFLELLTKFAHSQKTDLRLTINELRVLNEAPPAEAINLLYLLCVAKDA